MSERWGRIFVSTLAAAGVVLATSSLPRPATAQAVAQSGSAAPSVAAATETSGHPPEWGLLEQRCSKCHNSTDWAGGVAFDTLSADDIPADAETWEKAVRKLRGRLMPPPGEPQPDQQTIDAFVSWMEGELDRAAAAQPGPGLRRACIG